MRILLAIVIGSVLVVCSALVGTLLGVEGYLLGGVAGGVSAAIIATTLRPKKNS